MLLKFAILVTFTKQKVHTFVNGQLAQHILNKLCSKLHGYCLTSDVFIELCHYISSKPIKCEPASYHRTTQYKFSSTSTKNIEQTPDQLRNLVRILEIYREIHDRGSHSGAMCQL